MPAAKTITSNTNQDLSGDKQVVPYFWIKAIAAAVSGGAIPGIIFYFLM
ncbi:MAG: hypothetical protein G3M78_12840 [Candidatus Nitrohelix vancouverensis]|uniref:Uncharacterized protein n=1 Tax=Candidatus Nitrohelix vancouverensis TaxID=2705534 RepID=A0A7T0C483_9BACT|nr:MAG: hypothetical protein G3M78_12840 [Candidatus Nitrohelix vancouverensis]